MTEDERLAEIQRRIDECRRTHSTELDLGRLITNEVPGEVFELIWLEKLDISGDWRNRGQLKNLPSEFQLLTSLSILSFSGQEISDLNDLRFVPHLISLTYHSDIQLIPRHGGELQALDCFSDNRLKTLQGLAYVTQLRFLDVSGN